MKERLEVDTKKVEKTESRRKLELEGYSADLQNMRRKIEFYQKYISKLKSLVEEDRGVADLFSNLKNDDLRDGQMDMEDAGDSPSQGPINIEGTEIKVGNWTLIVKWFTYSA